MKTQVAIFVIAFFFIYPQPSVAEDDFGALEEPIKDLIRQIEGSGVKTIAVVDFVDLRGNVLELGRSLAEESTVLLVRHRIPAKVIDRISLHAILEEHKLTQSGLINPENAKELGRVSEVDALLTGTITPLEESVRLAFKVLGTETASIIAATSVTIERTRGVDSLLRREVPESRKSGAGENVLHLGEYEGIENSQRVEYLEVSLSAFEVMKDGELRATLKMRNLSPDGFGIAVALKAEHSGGVADFWKFFPTSTAEVTDNRGNRYKYHAVKGLGFARDRRDWTSIGDGGEATVVLSFRGSRQKAAGDIFSLTFDVWLAWGTTKSKDVQTGSFNIHLSNIRPKGGEVD